MSARFNHTIIAAADPVESAQFYVDLFEAEHTTSWGVFANVLLSDGVMLQFASPPPGYYILPVHMAFLCTDEHFDRAVTILGERGLDYWADPQRTRLHETNKEHGGRGVYFLDPSGMYLELITQPYL
ncbi:MULTISPECIES: VOC family protein [unclassified Brevibacterium]|uniref:VOC family protein n=1 Tax=unclassified Brevibacterium TaxID=2614124 RepID=UPI001E4B1CB6|nr:MULTISPECIES: VOC family protein [unclassified Brevibacterium]MCD1287732.1 glyoxalase [Brevibacterium sp. CCUG 69071]MDK8433335.1 VOC family protein [Brevibacterium sp. H-BE7]